MSQDEFVAALDAFEQTSNGPRGYVCEWLLTAPPEHVDAVRRALDRGITPTALHKQMKKLGAQVSLKGLMEHSRSGQVCERCRISLRD